MKISYACTVCNEFLEIQKLVTFLLENKRDQDEIVILYDSAHGDEGIEEYLRAKSVNGEFNWHKGEFEGHFANWKNKLTSLCSGDWIFNIDADEIPHKNLMVNLAAVVESNPETDVFWVPRVNTVEGLTEQDIKNWRWRVDKFESPALKRKRVFDLDDPQDAAAYEFLKKFGAVVSEETLT